MTIKKLFHSKRIIHTAHLAPGEYVKTFVFDGVTVIRIQFTNLQAIKGYNPTTDIFPYQVIKTLRLCSPFKLWWCGLFKLNAKPILKYQKRTNKVERNEVTEIGTLKTGDRFYKLGDKEKIVWSVEGPKGNKVEAIKEYDKWPTPMVKNVKVVFLRSK